MTRYRSHSQSLLHVRAGFSLLELLVVLAILGVLLALFLPQVTRSREAARRTQCRNNLKQIGLALHNYHDDFGAFPPANTVDAAGRPLHSWRMLLLPYIDQKPSYDRIDLTKPWDDPVNAKTLQTQLPAYQCPSTTLPSNHSAYLAVVTEHSVLRDHAPLSIPDIKDGTSNTIVVVEVDATRSVLWMSPQDADEHRALSFRQKVQHSHSGGTHVLLTDGAVRFLSEKLEESTARALLTADGGETIGDF